ncbi:MULTISPECIES: hypothetical protein [unclassified Streptomyces]|uniref:hypothetical protein n=1 Tax=unclassified Streptomyces TaxID=2593676 RepID=UPI0036E1CBC7
MGIAGVSEVENAVSSVDQETTQGDSRVMRAARFRSSAVIAGLAARPLWEYPASVFPSGSPAATTAASRSPRTPS